MLEDAKALTIEQFTKIITEIRDHHSFGKYGHHNWVKYVRPSFDMRDGKCFYLVLDKKEFDSRQCKTTMYEEIMKWLKRT